MNSFLFHPVSLHYDSSILFSLLKPRFQITSVSDLQGGSFASLGCLEVAKVVQPGGAGRKCHSVGSLSLRLSYLALIFWFRCCEAGAPNVRPRIGGCLRVLMSLASIIGNQRPNGNDSFCSPQGCRERISSASGNLGPRLLAAFGIWWSFRSCRLSYCTW